MDCRDAELALTALSDGAVTDPAEAAALREHCIGCETCSRYVHALLVLRELGAPPAPPDLADRIVAAVAVEAAAVEAEAAAALAAAGAAAAPATEAAADTAPALPADDAKPLATPAVPGSWRARLAADARVPDWLNRSRLWSLTSAVAVSAAAIVVAIVVSQNANMRGQMDQLAQENARLAPVTGSAPAGEVAASPAASTPAAPAPAPDRAPDYVVFRDGVFIGGPSVDASATALSPDATVLSALGSVAAPANVPTFRLASDPRPIVRRLPDGAYRRFDPVTRTYGTGTFQLQSGVGLARFGEWPRLVSGMSEPTSPDGSPTLRQYGLDSAGVPVYVRIGANPEAGFAVAPGTAATDPAAGNPFWTWWAPAP
jgi:hypothetical protein